jgi:hypothetical protein
LGTSRTFRTDQDDFKLGLIARAGILFAVQRDANGIRGRGKKGDPEVDDRSVEPALYQRRDVNRDEAVLVRGQDGERRNGRVRRRRSRSRQCPLVPRAENRNDIDRPRIGHSADEEP